MGVLITIFVIVVILPLLITWLVHKYLPKLLWCVPIATIIISGSLFFKDILGANEQTFAEKWALYFHNDGSMAFYLIYLPVVVASVIFSFIAYLLRYLKSNPKAHNQN